MLLDDVVWNKDAELTFLKIKSGVDITDADLEKFNKNLWRDEVCPEPEALYYATSCTFVAGHELADCSLSKPIDFSSFNTVTETEKICSPILYDNFLTHLD